MQHSVPLRKIGKQAGIFRPPQDPAACGKTLCSANAPTCTRVLYMPLPCKSSVRPPYPRRLCCRVRHPVSVKRGISSRQARRPFSEKKKKSTTPKKFRRNLDKPPRKWYNISCQNICPWHSWIARKTPTLEVAGSNPVGQAKKHRREKLPAVLLLNRPVRTCVVFVLRTPQVADSKRRIFRTKPRRNLPAERESCRAGQKAPQG